MTCRKTESLLPDYLGRELEPGAAVEVREHLASCARCRAESASLQKMLALAASEEIPPMPLSGEVFLQNVRRRIRQSLDARRRREPKPWVRLAPFFAALAVILIAAGIFVHSRQSSVRGKSATWAGEGNLVAVLAEPENSDFLDLAGGESELVRDIDPQAIAAIQSELTDDADVDELVEELTLSQQEELVRELARMYGGS